MVNVNELRNIDLQETMGVLSQTIWECSVEMSWKHFREDVHEYIAINIQNTVSQIVPNSYKYSSPKYPK